MRDVTQAPPVLEGPPWEDADAVAKWALAAMAEAGEERPAERVGDAGRNAFREKGGYDHWQKRAFERAIEGDFDVLVQFIAFVPDLGTIKTFEHRKILADIIAGQLKRRKRPRVWDPYLPEKTAMFGHLVEKALRIKSLLKRSYGQKEGINERVVFIMALKGSEHRKVFRYLEKGTRKVPHN
jgi:hypothetical protein